MECLNGKFTQNDYDELQHKIYKLQIEEVLHGVDNSAKIKEINDYLDEILGKDEEEDEDDCDEGMTLEEAKEAIAQFRAEGDSDEDMLKSFYMMYANDDITLNDLRVLTELVGWHFTEEFEAMSEADKKTKGLSQEDE